MCIGLKCSQVISKSTLKHELAGSICINLKNACHLRVTFKHELIKLACFDLRCYWFVSNIHRLFPRLRAWFS